MLLLTSTGPVEVDSLGSSVGSSVALPDGSSSSWVSTQATAPPPTRSTSTTSTIGQARRDGGGEGGGPGLLPLWSQVSASTERPESVPGPMARADRRIRAPAGRRGRWRRARWRRREVARRPALRRRRVPRPAAHRCGTPRRRLGDPAHGVADGRDRPAGALWSSVPRSRARVSPASATAACGSAPWSSIESSRSTAPSRTASPSRLSSPRVASSSVRKSSSAARNASGVSITPAPCRSTSSRSSSCSSRPVAALTCSPRRVHRAHPGGRARS